MFEDLEDFCEVEDFLLFFKSFKKGSLERSSSIRRSFGWKVFFSGAYTILCNFFYLRTRKFSLDFRGSREQTLYYSPAAWQHGAETCEIILNKIHSEAGARFIWGW